MSSGPIASATLKDVFETLTRADVDRWLGHRTEDLTLEFKTAPKAFSARDERKELARIISGFANAAGGLVIWGVRGRKDDAQHADVAQDVEPLAQPDRFLSELASLSGAATSPPVDGVQHRLLDDGTLAVTLIPESDSRPHMANLGQGRYFTRSGSRFLEMEHHQVLDAFSRRRRPELHLEAELLSDRQGPLVIRLLNTGVIIAKAPFVSVCPEGPWSLIVHQPGIDGKTWNLRPLTDSTDMYQRPKFGGGLDSVIHPGVALEICMFKWSGTLEAATRGLGYEIEYSFAAEDLPLSRGSLFLPRRLRKVDTRNPDANQPK